MTLPDSSTLTQYGGAKTNYDDPTNSSTDYDANQLNSAFSDVAEMTRTSERAFLRFTAASTTGAIVLLSWDANWKTNTTTAPVIAHVSTGHFTVTFPSTVLDELLVAHTLNIRCGHGAAEGSTLYTVQVSPSNVFPGVDLYVFSSAGSATDAVGANLCVFVK